MRHLPVVAVLISGSCLVWGQVAFPPGPSCAHGKAQFAEALREQGVYGEAPLDDFSTDTDLLHQKIEVEVEPATRHLIGSNTMTIRSQIDNLTLFQFRLDPVYVITDVEIGGVPVSWTRLDAPTVQVTLDRPYLTGEQFDLYIAYNGHTPNPNFWGGITFRTRVGASEIFTMSEPWFSHVWRPAKDDLRDKSTAEVWVTVPNTLVAGANGLLQGVDTLAGNKLRYRWQTNYPLADYLIAFGATNFHQFSSTWEYQGHSMPLDFFIYPEDDTPAHRDAWMVVDPALTTFSDLFGLYPWVNEKYGMLEWGWGGAMEHQTLTFINNFFDFDLTMVHELSHQWWGDNVTCATWSDIWLNEGFATYCEALWYEFRPGSPGAPYLHMVMSYLRPNDANGTVYCYNTMDPARVFSNDYTYLKGGWVLHMLRHVIGDANFFNTLAAYRAAFQGGAATTADFEQVAETVSGRNLSWFFNEWVYLSGAPQYSYAWQPYVLDGVGYVELYLKQVQTTGPVFWMPIDIVTTDAQGDHTHTVWNDARTQSLLFRVEDPNVTALQLDPTPWILATAVNQVAFVQGPPKIVTMVPEPNAAVPAAQQPGTLEVVFHRDVVAQDTDLTLVGARQGSVPVAFSYNAARHAAELQLAGPLPTDTYTLTVADRIVDAQTGLHLDGELTHPNAAPPLPSGNGLPGGSAVATFWIVSRGDVNCDGHVDFGDISPFVLALTDPAGYAQTYAGCPLLNGDMNGDGRVDSGDINPFVALLAAGG